jgi:hypothetical protein
MGCRANAHLTAWIGLWLTVSSAPGAPLQSQGDPAGWSDERKAEFLLNADIVSMREIGTGITRPRRAELDNGTVQHDAHIQTVDEFQARFEGERGVEFNFTDSYKYNIAAYRLDRLLGLRMVPVSVGRTVAGDRAAVTWWVDNDTMMMREFDENALRPPDSLAWADQIMSIRFFNELVYNTDANTGNFVIDEDWAIHMVDFTRAFRINDTLREPESIANIRIPRSVFDAVRTLDFQMLDEVMEGLLTDRQIRALLARRDLIVQSLEAQIRRRGEAGVLRD